MEGVLRENRRHSSGGGYESAGSDVELAVWIGVHVSTVELESISILCFPESIASHRGRPRVLDRVQVERLTREP